MGQYYRVIWTKSAVNDLEDIIEYISKDSPATAQTIYRELREKIETLSYMPNRGRYIPELERQGILIYRELVIPPWRVMYRVSGRNVYLLSVIDSRRNVEDILFKKLTKM